MMRKKIFGFIVLVFFFQQFSIAQSNTQSPNLTSNSKTNPLLTFSKEWESSIYNKCNTAKDLKYLSAIERDVIWILNMARQNPILFLNSVLLNPNSGVYKIPKARSSYYISLVEDLKILTPNQTPFSPDSNLFVTAKCHAYESGKTGYVGHDRKKNSCVQDFYGECCYYGMDDPFVIVISLLIDENVRSLGHRKIMLSKDYTLIGVSLQPHTAYGTNTVLDFK
jgi:uncharacterized protein YkwD